MMTKSESQPAVNPFLGIKANLMAVALLLFVAFMFQQVGFSQQVPASPPPPQMLQQTTPVAHLLGEASLKGLKKIEVFLNWGTRVPNIETEPWPTLVKMRPKILASVADSLRAAGFEVSLPERGDVSIIQDPEVALLAINLEAFPALPHSFGKNPQAVQSSVPNPQALEDRYICYYRIDLKQAASLLRDSQVKINATTLTYPAAASLLPLAQLEGFFTRGVSHILDGVIEKHDLINGDLEYTPFP